MSAMAAAREHRTVLATLLAALCLSSTLPLCSPERATGTKGLAPPSSRLPRPQAVDAGRSSSAVFPLYGNVYPNGLYFVSLSIGNPPKTYFLDVDTGSDLTWLQCNAPCVRCTKGPHPPYEPTKDKLVPCGLPICASVQATAAQKHPCNSPKDQCDYDVQYADYGFSHGVLIADAFSVRLVNGSLFRPRLAFGCGYDQQINAGASPPPIDGVLGLGRGQPGVVSQLRGLGLTRNVIGHCLGRKGSGFLFLGDDLVPQSGITWAAMSPTVSRNYYSPGPASLLFGGQLVDKNFQVILDSGSSYTYFSSRPYQALLQMLKKDLAGKPLKEAPEDRTLSLCWKGAKPFKSIDDVRTYFKALTLAFPQRNRAQLDIPPDNYLIVTKPGNVCLGILNGTQVGLGDLNIIGDISMQDLMVVYDNEKGQIGWGRANCDRLPKSGTAPL